MAGTEPSTQPGGNKCLLNDGECTVVRHEQERLPASWIDHVRPCKSFMVGSLDFMISAIRSLERF